MKNPLITEDCYVNVEGWPGEEVRKAAEIFSESLGIPIGDAGFSESKKYLMPLLEGADDDPYDIWVMPDTYDHNKVELTKDQVFHPEKYLQGTAQEIQVLFHMDIIDRAAEAVHKLHTMTSSVEDTRNRMMFAVKDALGRLQKNLEENPEYDRSVRICVGHWVVSLDWSDEAAVDLSITVNPTSMSKSPFIQTPLEDFCDSFVYLGDY